MSEKTTLTQKQRFERNEKIREYHLEHKDKIHDDVDAFSVASLAEHFGVTYSVIENIEKSLRAQKKLQKRDGFVTPTGEFEESTALRKSQRLPWIRRHKNWSVERLQAKLGFESIPKLRKFADQYKIRLKHVKSGKSSRTTESTLEKKINERLAERIAHGDLVSPTIGVDKLFEFLREEFAKELKETQISFTKAGFRARIDEVYWIKDRLDLLTEVMQSGLPDPIDEFCKSNRTVPRGMVEVMAKYTKGITSRVADPVNFIPGLGRLDLNEMDPEEINRFRLPNATASDPYVVPVEDSAFTVSVINGPNIGLAYDIDIERNVPRRALAESRVRGAKAVVISGLFDLDLKKAAGPLKVHRALVSGLKVKPELLEVSYQEQARKILAGRKDITAKDTRLLYLTIAERLELVVDAWHKITHRPKNRKNEKLGNEPEFDGSVLIVFGHKEEELITSAAYWEARWLTLQEQKNLGTLINLKGHELDEALEELAPDVDPSKNPKIIKLQEELTALERRRAKTIISDVSEEDLTRQFRRILPLVVKKFESVIPNSKVIGLGTSYVQFGDKVVEFNVPDHTKPTSTLLTGYTKSYAPKVLRGTMADSVVILHPHAPSHRCVDRSRDAKGKRRSLLVHVAPITIDGNFLRKRLKNTVRKVHPVSKLIFSVEFEPGMLVLDFHNNIVDGYPTAVSALALHEGLEKDKDGGWKHLHLPLMHDPVLRYINLCIRTDLHYGSRNREQVWDPIEGQYIGCDEMIALLLKRAGLYYTSDFPFHMESMLDDGVQANHLLLWQQQPNPQELPQAKIDKLHQEWRKRSEKATKLSDLRAILDEAAQLNLRQFLLRPPDWLQNQLRYLCHRYVDENIDFFGSVLSKALSANLILRGVSDIEGSAGDTRNLGFISTGSGNHGTKGTKGEMTEGWLISDRIWLRLLGDLKNDKWRKFCLEFGEEELRRLVRAPLYSNISTAWGTIQAPGGYEWAFDLRSSPPKMKGWTDTLAGWVFVDPSRGNYARFYENPVSDTEVDRVVIKACGDKHFHAAARVPYALYVMGAPCTHTDQFAEMAGGLPPNSTGISSVCLPKDGPNSGPIIVRFFPFERLKYFVEHPEVEVDWNAMFPNPL